MLVFLMGYMGCGKSTTGEKLAARLGYAFTDLDVLIEQKHKKSIPQIFTDEGESFFRESEMEVLHSCFRMNDTVIACGGGTPCFYDNLEQMKKNGTTVYLKLAAGSLFHRLAPGKLKRPLIANMPDLKLMEFIVSELDKRSLFYEQADLVVKGENLKMEELVGSVKKMMQQTNR